MSTIPGDLKYTESHEWVRLEDDGTATVGVTDFAQESLGDLVFVETPEEGGSFDRGDACAVVESVKAASDVYAPISGEVVAANERLADEPELINSDPFGEGWLMRMQPGNAAELDELLDAEAYQQVVAESD